MNIAKGLKRIYLIISVLWFLFFAFIGFTDHEILLGICVGTIPPLVLYYLTLWVLKGFKDE